MNEISKTIAIIGGGISGLYLAWRLQQLLPKDQFKISLYEKAEKLGGRIRTCDFHIREEGQEIKLSAELGAMRYPNRHLMLSSLIHRLSLDDHDEWGSPSENEEKRTGPFDLDNHYYIRGHFLKIADFEGGNIPYKLREEERGKSPAELLQLAISKALEQITLDPPDPVLMKRIRECVSSDEPLKPCEWMKLSRHGVFDDIRLRDIGFWNLIKHFLSSEAFLLCQDGFGFLSVISNWNAAEAFKWLIADFSPKQHFLNIRHGFSRLIDKLKAEIPRVGVTTATLKSIAWEGGQFHLEFAEGECHQADVDYVVLAIPPRAIQRIEVKKVNHDAWMRLFRSSRPHRLEKIVLAYQKPWWKETGIPVPCDPEPHTVSGRVFTDLPMRQIYYLDSEWLARSGFSEARGYSLILVYNDSLFEGFWRTFSIYNRVHVTGDIRDPNWLERALGPWPREVAYPDVGLAVDGGEEVRYRLEEKIRAQLKELHKSEVPVALGGVYKDWADQGGWHTWEPFVDVEETKKVIIQPFRLSGDRLEIWRPGGEGERLNLFVCGEAYAWEQGWVEGALMSAEALAAELGQILASSYSPPSWIDRHEWEDYMWPEHCACPSYERFKENLAER